MEICIGIISYFPDSPLRKKRVGRCKKLIEKCNEIFSLPTLVVAQNWREEIVSDNLEITVYTHALGITKARNELRRIFLNSRYDYIILFDDDCILEGDRESGKQFINFLQRNPDRYICGREKMFKLCAISREIFGEYPIPDISVEEKTGIEDLAFFEILEKSASEKKCEEYHWGNLREISDWGADFEISTWDRKDLGRLFDYTMDYLEKYKQSLNKEEI